MSGHFDQPRCVLSSHVVKMHGKWPMSANYFALWSELACGQLSMYDNIHSGIGTYNHDR